MSMWTGPFDRYLTRLCSSHETGTVKAHSLHF
jgi:hypothetical protein